MKRWMTFAVAALLGVVISACDSHVADGPSAKNRSLALVGAKIYPSPTVPSINDGVVVIKGGRIVDVGARTDVKIPADVEAIDCAGLVLTSAFWNSHVHFT